MLNLKITSLIEGFTPLIRSTEHAGAFDIFLPMDIIVYPSMTPAQVQTNADGIETITPFTGGLIPLGFTTEFEPGHVGLIIPRSGLGTKHGFSLRNTAGLIDADYRGEWMMSAHTHWSSPQVRFEAGTRIAQVLFTHSVVDGAYELNGQVVPDSTGDQRVGGFGSSGI